MIDEICELDRHLALVLGLVAETNSYEVLIKLLLLGEVRILGAFRYSERVWVLINVVRHLEEEDACENKH